MRTHPCANPVRTLLVDGRAVAADQQGCIRDMDEWTPGFASALAEEEGLVLTEEHWEVIHYLRGHYAEHAVPAQARDMIRHFRKAWGPERGNNCYLCDLFPFGGPQKHGNRLAGIRRTTGEH